MSFAFAALFALASTPAPATLRDIRHHPQTHQHAAQGGWRLDIRRDNFTGQTLCRLRGRSMVYQQEALGLATHLHGGFEGLWFRLDGGSPARWRDLYPALVASATLMERGGMDDPFGGVVWMPLELVHNVHEVALHTASPRHAKILRFRLGGFTAMRDKALQMGCPADGFVT